MFVWHTHKKRLINDKIRSHYKVKVTERKSDSLKKSEYICYFRLITDVL